jgi:hypothetical protein
VQSQRHIKSAVRGNSASSKMTKPRVDDSGIHSHIGTIHAISLVNVSYSLNYGNDAFAVRAV